MVGEAMALDDGSAPFIDALRATVTRDTTCFHFPGHNKGAAAPSPFSQLVGLKPFIYDSPEPLKIGSLFSESGPIVDSQKMASGVFGSEETRFLVGGSSCGIWAAILATCSAATTIILPRNAHVSATSGLIFSGAQPKYVQPEYSPQWGIAGGVTPAQILQAFEELEQEGKQVGAALVVSPTYQGVCSDVEGIAAVCHSRGVPLIVDEAHGPHFRFHPQLPDCALDQGADIVVQSTHKVLGSLTQSSMLHVSGILVDRAKLGMCLKMLQSSSPSYLLLASLDAVRARLSAHDSVQRFQEAISLSLEARDQILSIPGIDVLGLESFSTDFPAIDPLRITVGFWRLGITGYEASRILNEQHNIVTNIARNRCVSFILNLGNRREDVQSLVDAIRHLSSKHEEEDGGAEEQPCDLKPPSEIKIRLSPREAFFATKERAGLEESVGRICGELVFPYPPGIPVLIPGEEISEASLEFLLKMKEKGAEINGAADSELRTLVVCKI